MNRDQTICKQIKIKRILSFIMQLAKTHSKKWVDYSDSSEEQQDQRGPSISPPSKDKPSTTQTPVVKSTQPDIDHRSPEYIQSQLKRLDQCGHYKKDLWLELVSKDQVFLDKKMFELKGENHEDIFQIEISQEVKGAWNVRVRKNIIQKWLRQGIDQQRKIKVIVSLKNIRNREEKQPDNRERNGDRGQRRGRGDRRNGGDRREGGGGERRQRRERDDRGDRGQRGQRGERRGRGRRDRDFNNGEHRNQEGGQRRRRDRDHREGGQQKKKVYVDKETGKPPTNKQECEKRLIQQKERHYTRSEAEKMGMQLGNFRNKPKVDPKLVEAEVQRVQIKEQRGQDIKLKEQTFERKPKQGGMWTRKQRTDKPPQESAKVKPKYTEKSSKYVQNSQEAGQNKEAQKKKKYVRVDDIPQVQRKQKKYKRKDQSEQGAIEEPKQPRNDFIEEDS